MDINNIKTKITELRKTKGKSREDLAEAINLSPTTLSNKLNGTQHAHLTQDDLKKIIIVFVIWNCVTELDEVEELIVTFGLPNSIFSEDEWGNPPLNTLHKSLSKSTSDVISLTNLPKPSTTFIGREDLIEQIVSLLKNATTRLVTLTGAGGIGKTRIALKACTNLESTFTDGVYFVSLAALKSQDQMLLAIARSIGIREIAGISLFDNIKRFLRRRRALIIFDNFEHLLPSAYILGEMLEAAPYLKILVTSRSVLHLYGEWECPIPPLSLPLSSSKAQSTAILKAEALASEAVKLFVQRAQQVKPSFVLTHSNLAAIVELCEKLDALPLAIELAAARSKILSPQSMVQKINDHRFDLLSSGIVNLPNRQQTLRGAIDWSYDLLSNSEKRVLAQMAVFPDGCTIQSLEIICQENQNDILLIVESLVNQSMLQQNEFDTDIYLSMFQSIREYILEKLSFAGDIEKDCYHQRQADYMLRVVRSTISTTDAFDHQNTYLSIVDRQINNLRTAMVWFDQSNQSDKLLLMVSNLWMYWYLDGYFTEGLFWLEKALSMPRSTEDGLVRIQALEGAATLALMLGEARAKTFLEESLNLSKQIDHSSSLMLNTLVDLGILAWEQQDYDHSILLFEEALQRVEQETDFYYQQEKSAILTYLGKVSQAKGDYTRAKKYYKLSLSAYEAISDVRSVISFLQSLVNIAEQQKDYDEVSKLQQQIASLAVSL